MSNKLSFGIYIRLLITRTSSEKFFAHVRLMKLSTSCNYYFIALIFLYCVNSFAADALLHTLNGHDGWVRAVAIDGENIYSAADDGFVYRWVKNRTDWEKQSIQKPSYIKMLSPTKQGWYHKLPGLSRLWHINARTDYVNNHIFTTPTSQLVASVHGDISIYNYANKLMHTVEKNHNNDFIYASALHKNAFAYARFGNNKSTIIINNAPEYNDHLEYDLELDKKDTIQSMAFSPEGNFLLLGSRQGYLYYLSYENYELILLSKIKAADETINLLSLSIDRYLVFSTSAGALYGLSLDDPSQVSLLSEQPLALSSLLIDPNAQFIFAGTTNGELLVWRLKNQGFKKINHINAHGFCLSSFALSPALLVTGSFDKSIKVWDLIKLLKQTE